jgi:imidazolonepropionase-like amidohydrolase
MLLIISSMTAQATDPDGHRETNPPRSENSSISGDSRGIAFVGGKYFDVQRAEVVEDAVIRIRGNEIVEAGNDVDVGPQDDVKNVNGLTVVPGLVDSHFHSINQLDLPSTFLANGVTTLRDPGHPFRFYQAVRQTDQPMPRVFLCGAHLDAYPPIYPRQARLIKDAADARAAVNEHVDAGATAIKIYFQLPLALYPAVCETAAERDVLVTAHLELVQADDAVRAGVRGIEHVTSFGTALAEPDVAREFIEQITADADARWKLRYQLWADVDLNSTRVREMIRLIVDHEVFVSPTLAVFERRVGDKNASEIDVRGYEKMIEFVGMCHRAGATIVVGSHTHAPHAETGWAYQRELELLVEAGLTPAEALVAATRNGARFFGAQDRLGSIEPGKLADLVFVDGDPTEDISTMRNIRHVLSDGRWIGDPPETAK